jgi:hypothetical protein
MSPQGCEGAIELLGKHGAREFVGISHRREGEQQVRASAPAGWKPVCSADDEYKVSGFAFRALNERGEGGGIEALSGRIETDSESGRMFRPRIGACPQLRHFGFCVMRNAPQIIFGNRVDMRIPRLAKEIKMDLHSGRDRNILGVPPEPFQIVIGARFFGKDVDQKIAVVG